MLGREMALLFYYVTFSFIVELLTLYLAMNSINNLWVLHIYTFIEFTVMVSIFSQFKEMIIRKKLAVVLVVIYFFLWIASKVFLESMSRFDTYSVSVANIVLTLIALWALFQSGQTMARSIWKTPLFWFSIAALIKFAGDFCLFLFGEWFIHLHLSDGLTVWSLHWTISILSNIGFFLALICPSQTSAPTGS